MPNSNFFARLGLFVVEDFFDQSMCDLLRCEMAAGNHTQAKIVAGTTGLEKVNAVVRSTKDVNVSAATAALVESRLRLLKPKLESHFNLTLDDCEKPQFLTYQPGDFFRPHRDGDDDPRKPEYISKRRVSLIVFLNNESGECRPETGTYSGGSLTLYGLINKPQWSKYGFKMSGKAGVLIAFRSEMFHEVTAVTAGERHTIASWFF